MPAPVQAPLALPLPLPLPPEAWAWAWGAGFLLALLVVAILARLRRAWRRWRLRARFAHAAQGEARANRLLEEHGFAIIGAQVSTEYPLRIDERVVTVRLRADYIVSRDGKRYVAEVKTGVLAPQIETAATRRQLLEYRMAFDVDGVLLVDAESDSVRVVAFPDASPPVSKGMPLVIVLILALLAAAGMWFAYRGA